MSDRAVRVTATDLTRILRNALLFVADDDHRPALCCVRIVVDAERVWAIAANPYRLALDSCKRLVPRLVRGDKETDDEWTARLAEHAAANPPPAPFELTMPPEIARELAAEAKRYVKLLRGQPEPDKYAFTIRGGDEVLNDCMVSSLEQERRFSEEANYPDFRKVIYPEVTQPYVATERAAVSPSLLADFRKVQPIGAPLIMRFRGELNPVEISIGETFRSLLMPMRIPGEKYERGAWVPDPSAARIDALENELVRLRAISGGAAA